MERTCRVSEKMARGDPFLSGALWKDSLMKNRIMRPAAAVKPEDMK